MPLSLALSSVADAGFVCVRERFVVKNSLVGVTGLVV